MSPKPKECRLKLSEIGGVLSRAGLMLDSSGQDTLDSSSCRLRTDSRSVQPGDIFLAYRGNSADGHAHLSAAKIAGAALLIVDNAASLSALGKAPPPWILVKDSRAAWSHLAAHAFGNPQKQLKFVGVTGTNGKTSTVWMCRQLLLNSNHACLSIGTLGAYFCDEHLPSGHTTPDPDVLYGWLAEAVARGIGTVVMEVSSHALVQEKLAPIRYTACGFTSFSRDHLDFHGTMEKYLEAKTQLFTRLSADGATFAIAKNVPKLALSETAAAHQIFYEFNGQSTTSAQGLSKNEAAISTPRTSITGSSIFFRLGDTTLAGEVPYFSGHALENFAAALLLCRPILGRLPDPSTWNRLAPVPGRLEQVGGQGVATAIIDYAHTPDALEKTLAVVRSLAAGKIRVVFGCGGDRDRGKRPLMGAIASRLADRVFITSDNPRTEDPEAILKEILSGVQDPKRCVVEVDRKTAIEQALSESQANDVVLIAGKGHEKYQIFRDKTLPFDDVAVARLALGV